MHEHSTEKTFLSLLWLVVPIVLSILVICVTAGYCIYRRAIERAYRAQGADYDYGCDVPERQDWESGWIDVPGGAAERQRAGGFFQKGRKAGVCKSHASRAVFVMAFAGGGRYV